MTIFPKMLVLLVIHLGAIGYLIWRQLKVGNPFAKALLLTWNTVVAPQPTPEYSIQTKCGWGTVLSKTWWMMLFLFLVFWLIFQEWYLWTVILFLIVVHIVWYRCGHLKQAHFNRVFNLNEGWGIIYQTVSGDSDLNAKTLAELDLRKKNLLVLAIERGGQITAFPKGTETLSEADRVIIFGELTAFEANKN